jgi:ABC-type nitrate/sulfonate/bicarbonate transport system permease component/ABC-type nitrate/sulfonate/bicarbonate transport system substrate-binding protein
MTRASALGRTALVFASLLALWEAAVRLLAVPAYLLPAPSGILVAFGELGPVLPEHLAATITTALLGLVLAAATGVACAVLMTSLPLVRRVLSPLLVTSQTVPPVVFAPLLIAWFGLGLAPKVLVVALVGFFPVAISTADALTGADSDLTDLVRSMGAGRRALYRHVLLPSALPGFFAGLTVAATYAMLGAIIAEWMGASRGLGLLLTRSAASFRIDRVFVGVVLVALVSIGLYAAVRVGARLTMPWRSGALLLVAALALAGCAGGEQEAESAGELRPVTLMLNWTPNAHHAGIYAAQENGWYEEAGLRVEIIEPSQAGADQAVASGEVEFGISQAESVLPARSAGAPVVSIATLLPSNDSALMSLSEDGITRPRDLAGRTYGGYGGALETELVSRLVECDGGDASTVEFVEVGNVDYLAGLQQDRYDFVWVFNGWDALAAEAVQGADVATIPFAEHFDCIPDWYTPVVIANESLIADDPELARDFLAATARGYELAREDPAEAARLLLQAAPELDERLVQESVAYHADRFALDGEPWGIQDEEVWREFADFVAEAGLTEGSVDVGEAFTNDLLSRS